MLWILNKALLAFIKAGFSTSIFIALVSNVFKFKKPNYKVLS